MIKDPPKRALRFLEWFCPGYLFEGIEGDLLEQFDEDVNLYGERRAGKYFWWNVLRFFRPSIITRNNYTLKILNTMMLSNYFKITARSMMKSKLYSFINAFGLSIGMAFCMLIYLYIQDEKSFDQFHANKDQIYRMQSKSYDTWQYEKGGEIYDYMAYMQTGLGPALKDELAEVVMSTRHNHGGEGVVSYGDHIFQETLTYVDADFFKMFSFELLEGSKESLFSDQYEAVITPDLAEKYFGNESPLNKVIDIDHEGVKSFTITGVIAPPPPNSSINYNIMLRTENRPYYKGNMENWASYNTPTFVMLNSNVDMTNFDQNLGKLVDKYLSENIASWEIPEELKDIIPFEYQYTNLSDIHLDTQIPWYRSSDPQYSLILGAIAILILIIACINYVSLALTTSKSRRVEVGVRKTIGANRSQVIYQFAFESVILALISMFIGLGLMWLFLPSFNEFTNKGIALDGMSLLSLVSIGVLISFIVGLVAGSYPSLVLSSFKPAEVLKSSFSSKINGGFTKQLVIIQFALSAFLIVSSIIMYRQMEFITTKDLGYNKDQILVIPTQTGWNDKANQAVGRMRQALSQHGAILSVAGTSSSFNKGTSLYGYEIDDVDHSAYVYGVDSEYIHTLGIELKEGRNFDPNLPSDTTAIVVNEALVVDMGWDNPVGEYLNWREDTVGLGAKVVGVLKDYHFQSLEREVKPLFLSMDKGSAGYLINILVKVAAANIPASLKLIEQEWRTLYPNRPFDYNFMSEDIDRQYRSYTRWMNIMGLATVFAILISCLGLFGISGVNAINRTKEIGIRKVMGAELSNIFLLLNKQYVWLSIIAFAVASPASWYVMSIWLSDFEFAITIGWEIFVVSMLAGLLVALTTVSYHAIKSALVNPAETLKYE
jgi:putative ABC transport system permease protein